LILRNNIKVIFFSGLIKELFVINRGKFSEGSSGTLVQNVHNFIYCLDRINWINWIFLPCVPFPDERLNWQSACGGKKRAERGASVDG
jgi:hypothetical protein